MSFVYPQVTITTSRDAYITVANADDYFAQQAGNDAVWTAYSATKKAQGIRQGTLLLDRLHWDGAKTDATNALQFPRTGLVDQYGVAVDSATLPTVLGYATCELALALLIDPTIASNAQGTTQNAKRLKAGTAEVEFFKPVSGTRIPTQVYEWIASFFGAMIGNRGSFASSTSCCSSCGCTVCTCPPDLNCSDRFDVVH